MKTPSYLSLQFFCELLKVAPFLDSKLFNSIAKLSKFRVVKFEVSFPTNLDSF